MAFSFSEIPTDRVVWIRCLQAIDLDAALANVSADAPAVIVQQVRQCESPGAIVASALDEMEAVAIKLFPAWLSGAEGIVTSAGAGLAAVRGMALDHAAHSDQYGPFLADLAAGALTGRGPHTRRHQSEVRAPGLARVIATGFGRSACALLLQAPPDLDDHGALALVRAAQWLVDQARLAVWIGGESLPAVDWLPEISMGRSAPAGLGIPEIRKPTPLTAQPSRRSPASMPRRRGGVGKPHPTSRTEVALEAALVHRPWAAGRVWNHTVRPGPLVNPVRVDLLWKRERCIVEIDGDDHRAAQKYAEDRRRDVMLQLNGYAVLRFTNSQVRNDIENVLALLHQFLANRRRVGKES